MLDWFIVILVVGLVAAIVLYLRREKKRGVTCVGCPYAGQCARSKSGEGGCGRTPW